MRARPSSANTIQVDAMLCSLVGSGAADTGGDPAGAVAFRAGLAGVQPPAAAAAWADVFSGAGRAGRRLVARTIAAPAWPRCRLRLAFVRVHHRSGCDGEEMS